MGKERLKKKIAIITLIIMVLLFIVGLRFIFSAYAFGQNKGYKAIENNYSGTIDTKEYERMIDNTASSYRIGGLAISLIGGSGLLLSGYVFYREI